MDQVTIYALCDPLTGEVRYVGKANDVDKRLRSHLRDSRTRATPLYSWLRKLTAEKRCPTVQVLRVVDACDWEVAEREAIASYRVSGRLLNVADGGAVPSCPKVVRAKNAKATAAARELDPVKKHIWNIKRRLGSAYADKTLPDALHARVTASMREAARLHPHIFGAWASLP